MMEADEESENGGRRNNGSSTPKQSSGAVASCGLCCFKLKAQTQISALEYKITNRQKKFGVDYLTLVERKAGQAALKGCLKEALRDVAALQTQINDHYDNIDKKKEETEAGTATAATPSNNEAKPKRRGKPEAGEESGERKAPTKKKSGTKKKKKKSDE